MAKCSVCEREYKLEELIRDLDELICPECMEKTVRCDDCMERVLITDSVQATEGRHTYNICNHCKEETVIVCAHCGEVHIREYMSEVVVVQGQTEIWCKKCRDQETTLCNDCHRYVLRNTVEEDYDGNRICPECRPRYSRCEECGRLGITERMVEVEEEEEGVRLLCQRCDREISNERYIHDYGYKPVPIFRHIEGNTTTENGKLYLGTELEIGTGGENHRKAKQILRVIGDQKAYAKHDGSVSNGFEIVTHPCTLEYHREQFGWKELCKKALSLGYRGHDNQSCGMHVHINRSFLGRNPDEVDDVVSKMILMVENNWNDVVKFSRREQSRIDQWAGRYSSHRTIENCKNKKEKCKKLINNAKCQSDRRRAINITNINTIEFRLFRSTLKSNTIIANLQFCSLIAICAKKWTHSTCERVKFANLKHQAEKLGYTEFMTYCEERGM